VMIAKFTDHMPLYRQKKIFDRAGWASGNVEFGPTLTQRE